MGRKKGSKNKVKADVVNPPSVVEINPPIDNSSLTAEVKAEATVIGLTGIKKRERKHSLPTQPDWILTKTIYGTQIAIEGICKVGTGYQFVVTPNYKERTSKTMVDSRDVIKPIFATPKQEKEFENIPFGVKSIEQPITPETITQSPDTITESPNTLTQSPETTTLKEILPEKTSDEPQIFKTPTVTIVPQTTTLKEIPIETVVPETNELDINKLRRQK